VRTRRHTTHTTSTTTNERTNEWDGTPGDDDVDASHVDDEDGDDIEDSDDIEDGGGGGQQNANDRSIDERRTRKDGRGGARRGSAREVTAAVARGGARE